jgi:hypothetical protein
MTTSDDLRERDQFTAALAQAYPSMTIERLREARDKLLTLARQHGRLAVEECNGPDGVHLMNSAQIAEWQVNLDLRQTRCEERIKALIADRLPGTKLILGGDPRGYTVKLILPTGAYNTMGGKDDGWGVPQ